MTIGFPDNRVWNAANWVVRGFIDDARPHLAEFPLLAERIERNYLTELWSFDVETVAELDEMQRLVARVIADNEESQGASFHDPGAFPVYLGKLRDLARLVEQARGEPAARPAGPRTVEHGRVIVDEGLYLAAGQGIFRGHLVDDPQQKRLVTQAVLHEVTAAELARRHALELPGIAPLEYAGPIDAPDHIGWNGDCLVEVEPRGQPSIELAPIDETNAVRLGLDLLEVVARAHASGLTIGGIRPELIYVRRDVESRLRLAGLVPRGAMFLARSYPLSSGDPPFTRLYTALRDPDLLPAGDVFAVSMSLLHLVMGEHPFGDHYLEEVPRMMSGERPGWTGSPLLGEILMAGIEMDHTRRPGAAELAARLRAL